MRTATGREGTGSREDAAAAGETEDPAGTRREAHEKARRKTTEGGRDPEPHPGASGALRNAVRAETGSRINHGDARLEVSRHLGVCACVPPGSGLAVGAKGGGGLSFRID
jgi:hypothetical protein